MVSDKVEVYSKTADGDSTEPAHYWTSDGTGSYTIKEATGVQRGTKVKIITHSAPQCRVSSKEVFPNQIAAKCTQLILQIGCDPPQRSFTKLCHPTRD